MLLCAQSFLISEAILDRMVASEFVVLVYSDHREAETEHSDC
jgi:hypothetical protein